MTVSTVSMNFTAEGIRDIESQPLFQLLHCYYSTFGHSLLFLIIYAPVVNFQLFSYHYIYPAVVILAYLFHILFQNLIYSCFNYC